MPEMLGTEASKRIVELFKANGAAPPEIVCVSSFDPEQADDDEKTIMTQAMEAGMN